MLELFPGMIQKPTQSDKCRQHLSYVTSSRPRNVNLVSIDYGFRPRLRGRLTLRGLTLRRNPWTYGDRVSHSVCRYSCQHSHFRYLQDGSPRSLRRPTERSATDQLPHTSRPLSDKRANTRQCKLVASPVIYPPDNRRLAYDFRSRSFGAWFEPRYIFGAGFILDQ